MLVRVNVVRGGQLDHPTRLNIRDSLLRLAYGAAMRRPDKGSTGSQPPVRNRAHEFIDRQVANLLYYDFSGGKRRQHMPTAGPSSDERAQVGNVPNMGMYPRSAPAPHKYQSPMDTNENSSEATERPGPSRKSHGFSTNMPEIMQ